jgi:hypothetical protein
MISTDPIVATTLSIIAIVVSVSIGAVNVVLWFKKREDERKKHARESEWEQIRFARELTDRIIARQERLDDYLENVSNGKTQYIYERHIDRINNVLRECEYFGSLVAQEKIQESELLGHDRQFVYEVWRELNLEGQALCEDIQDAGLFKSHSRKINKFNELLRLIMKHWGPEPKEQKDTGK